MRWNFSPLVLPLAALVWLGAGGVAQALTVTSVYREARSAAPSGDTTFLSSDLGAFNQLSHISHIDVEQDALHVFRTVGDGQVSWNNASAVAGVSYKELSVRFTTDPLATDIAAVFNLSQLLTSGSSNWSFALREGVNDQNLLFEYAGNGVETGNVSHPSVALPLSLVAGRQYYFSAVAGTSGIGAQSIKFRFDVNETTASGPPTVPEPASLALAGVGLAGIALRRRGTSRGA